MSTGFGDRLARGSVRASFGPVDVSQEKWDAAFAPAEPEATEPEKSEEVKKAESHVRVGLR